MPAESGPSKISRVEWINTQGERVRAFIPTRVIERIVWENNLTVVVQRETNDE